jgi:hypothetical protein
MTVTQTIDIPADCLIMLEVPREVPPEQFLKIIADM